VGTDSCSRSLIGPYSDCGQVAVTSGHRTGLSVSSVGCRAAGGFERTRNIEATFDANFHVYSDIEMHRLWKTVHFAAVNSV